MDVEGTMKEEERQRELRRIARIVRKDWTRIAHDAELRKCRKVEVVGYEDTMSTAAVLAMAEEWEGEDANFVRGIVAEHDVYIEKKKSVESVAVKINTFWRDWGNLSMAGSGKGVVQFPGFTKWLERLDELAVEGRNVLLSTGEEVEVTEWLRGAVNALIELQASLSQISDAGEVERRVASVGPGKWM